MRYQSLFLAFAAASGLAIFASPWTPKDQPDFPAEAARPTCLLDPVKGSALAPPAEIRSFQVAGIHLGMPAEEAFRALASVSEASRIGDGKPGRDARSIIGKAAWSDYAWAHSFQKDVLPIGGQWADPADNVVISTSIYPDGRERVSSVRYSVVSFSPMPTAGNPSPRNGVTSQMEKWLTKRLGQPSYRSGNCGSSTIMTYGSETQMRDTAALSTYSSCRVSGGITGNPEFICDRRRALQQPWLGLFGGTRSFDLLIQDGEAAYSTRYAPGFEASHPNLEH